ncbi:MAG TPA: hypothetical protein VNS19_19735 [Acidimicrobiales bacterium]|jgi:hypothetical protein|nr:hypothetical protein [Acidimicrobiales bacterium]
MTHPLRSLVVAGTIAALALGAAGCGSSGSDATPTTDGATTTTTAAGNATTTTGSTTTSTSDRTTTTQPYDAASGDLDCQALLQEYADAFDPDQLADAVAFFRKYEPAMPDDVAAATERLAVAYEEAGDLGHIDLADVDLTADAQTFSDWTNDGCPAG